ncbi:inositol 2-dehydrogenase [Skermania sp. ID1734]|uniref:Gfo/Idh/MocA family protein n=1 Tax=Skermania sp. ID1734 TaxID=2597516 RepID=UPI0011810F4C|nr:Gfo/Idh/MocA family oxidoreductase [Skermania sp. ID1734]TSE00977.1 inositol 2-dehydrogenase [Skermania sp. ID1734]
MSTLRVGVIGAGVMGTDHALRITSGTTGAKVRVVSDVCEDRARAVASTVGARVVIDPFDAITDPDVDAVLIASPAHAHEKQLLACLAAGKPVLCEKPLTTDAHTALGVVEAEAATGRRLIQLGFMRRFDSEYMQMRERIGSGRLGTPLLIHCTHRNASVPSYYDNASVVNDSLVHEIDAARFLLGSEIAAVTMVSGRSSPKAPEGLRDPQLALLETTDGVLVDVELFVTTGTGYEVRAEVVGSDGSAVLGLRDGVTGDFRQRFSHAYARELQCWIDAVRGAPVDVATGFVAAGSWDGYAAAAVCAAARHSLVTGGRVTVEMASR